MTFGMNIEPLGTDLQLLSCTGPCAAAIEMKVNEDLLTSYVFCCHKREFCSTAALAGVSGRSHAVGRAQQTECVNRRQQHQ